MSKRQDTLAAYKIFGSKLRGTEEVEAMVATFILEKETPENLELLANKMSVEWRYTEENVSRLKLAFSKFEEKLEKRKPEIVRAYAQEKEKRKVVSALSVKA